MTETCDCMALHSQLSKKTRRLRQVLGLLGGFVFVGQSGSGISPRPNQRRHTHVYISVKLACVRNWPEKQRLTPEVS